MNWLAGILLLVVFICLLVVLWILQVPMVFMVVAVVVGVSLLSLALVLSLNEDKSSGSSSGATITPLSFTSIFPDTNLNEYQVPLNGSGSNLWKFTTLDSGTVKFYFKSNSSSITEEIIYGLYDPGYSYITLDENNLIIRDPSLIDISNHIKIPSDSNDTIESGPLITITGLYPKSIYIIEFVTNKNDDDTVKPDVELAIKDGNNINIPITTI